MFHVLRHLQETLRAPAIGLALLLLAPSGFLALIAASKGLYLYHAKGTAFWSGPHAGEQVLPAAAQDAIALLREHDIPSFRLNYTDIDPWTERTREGAWPIRYDPGAKYVLWLDPPSETPCTLIDRRNRVALYACGL